ncbi:MAG TPA: hypothetical protein H9786_13210 [Candidatus Brachybacterium merdavium]|uniref:Uncharacterized protein n=1 Tax=Candidatus Brachybacterium merdavium TaxID=2838513 RepID=A0A9D2LF43_9MICO|nr:hypothetical protein [Candidatus Brachybacterium merdavium]
MIQPLQWFPKRFSPGDMDASGGDRLLGKTELSRLAVLIRETAQNSWDAKNEGARPLFGVSLRRTDFRLREDLASLLSEGRLTGLTSLRRNANFRILEIYDRGTKGLDGPADLSPVGKGRSARFQDLILKLGVSHNNGTTGGTYGFGKTAAFAYSGIGTVAYWTRCRNPEGELEDRFIVSAYGESYQDKGVQYTGRHWWGALSTDGESILPLVGQPAVEVGEKLFERRFEEGETGTSLLILDPLIADEEDAAETSAEPLDRFDSDPIEMEDDFVRRSRHAIRANLWPKMIPAPHESDAPMALELRVNGESVDLGSPSTGALALWGSGLNAIRAARSSPEEISTPHGLPVKVIEITWYKQVVGHLALVRRVPAVEPYLEFDDLDPARGDESGLLRIALMRGQAELVVTTVDWVQREAPAGADWLAVYKSADEFDEHYAEAEPPAHDNWVTEGSSSKSSKIIRQTKNRVRRCITEEIHPAPQETEAGSAGRLPSTGELSRRLGAIMPAPAPQLPDDGEPHRPGRRRGPTRPSWSVEADAPRLLETDAQGMQLQEISFIVLGEEPIARVRLNVSLLGDEGLHEQVPPETLGVQWVDAAAEGLDAANVRTGQEAIVRFIGAPRRALRVELTAGGPDGRT